MSAFFSMCYEDRIELLTDGAVYEEDGTLVDIREKVWRSPRWPLAVTGRGAAGYEKVAKTFELAGFLGASLEETIDRVQASLLTMPDKAPPEPFEVLIAAFVDGSPKNLYLSSVGMGNFKPWTLYDVGSCFGGGPQIDEASLLEAGISLDGLQAGLQDQGADLFELMRKAKGCNPIRPDLPPVHGVGGHVDLTVVRPGAVCTKRLRTWPDEVGQKIRPG